MSDGGEDGSDTLTLVANNRPATKRDDESVAAGDAYATVKGPRTATSLKFIRRDRPPFAVPYAYLPIPWCQAADTLLVEYPGLFTVALLSEGGSVEGLDDLIAEHKLLRIRECERRVAAILPCAVTRILILGSYPSREDATDALPEGQP
jgi:hypothetical protein